MTAFEKEVECPFYRKPRKLWQILVDVSMPPGDVVDVTARRALLKEASERIYYLESLLNKIAAMPSGKIVLMLLGVKYETRAVEADVSGQQVESGDTGGGSK